MDCEYAFDIRSSGMNTLQSHNRAQILPRKVRWIDLDYNMGGTAQYLAPEHKYRTFGYALDIWATG